jgi:hypothetical protein
MIHSFLHYYHQHIILQALKKTVITVKSTPEIILFGTVKPMTEEHARSSVRYITGRRLILRRRSTVDSDHDDGPHDELHSSTA